MATHSLAGKPAPRHYLIDFPQLVSAYYSLKPNPHETSHKVSFGTSGHRGSSLKHSFNEAHILAISQAICEVRRKMGVDGPLYLGRDTHALSYPALVSALEVFASHGVQVMMQQGMGYTPTPVISHAILTYNKGRDSGLADGVVITPSHNPPEDGGFKYNPPQGGPADARLTKVIEDRANELIESGIEAIKRVPFEKAMKAGTTHQYDYLRPYLEDLSDVVDMKAIGRAGLKIGVDPLGGSGVAYWEPMAEMYGLDLTVVNPVVDPTFSFMSLDKDGKIRMDCSSPYAMAGLIGLKDRFDIAFGNDPDYDRHGIVTQKAGLLNPNHFLAVSVWHLFRNRPQWPQTAALGKTLVSSSLLDRVSAGLGRELVEVPVGFKWFVDGLLNGKFGFAGEESAGASFLRKSGEVWSTDKDGIIMDLLAAEITATSGLDPADIYAMLEERFGSPLYERIQAPANASQKKVLKNLSPDMVTASHLAGEEITAKLTKAPGNDQPFGGLKVTTRNGWFAARPSGTEEIYKIYTESFKGRAHLEEIQREAREIVGVAFANAGV